MLVTMPQLFQQERSKNCRTSACWRLQKGKRGGSEFCNYHKRMGEENRRKLTRELENNKLTIEINPPHSTTIDPYEIDISKIDIEPDKHTYLSIGMMFILFSFMSFIIAIQSDDGICGMLGTLSFVIGSIFSLSASSESGT